MTPRIGDVTVANLLEKGKDNKVVMERMEIIDEIYCTCELSHPAA